MNKKTYILLIICIIIITYSSSIMATKSKTTIKQRMNKLFASIEKNNLKSFLSCFSKNYLNKTKNEHGTTIAETYQDLPGRFPYNDDIAQIKIKQNKVKIMVKNNKAKYTTKLTIYTKYKNGLSYTKENKITYTLTKEENKWLIININ